MTAQERISAAIKVLQSQGLEINESNADFESACICSSPECSSYMMMWQVPDSTEVKRESQWNDALFIVASDRTLNVIRLAACDRTALIDALDDKTWEDDEDEDDEVAEVVGVDTPMWED